MSAEIRVGLDVSAVPHRPAGAGRYIVELARNVSQDRQLALELFSRRGDRRWSLIAPAANNNSIIPKSRPLRLLFEQTALPRFAQGRIDVAHSPHYTTLPIKNIPRVTTIHDMSFFTHPEYHEKSKVWFFRKAIEKATTEADALICVSEETSKQLAALFSPRGEVCVIEHGIDHERFNPSPLSSEDEIISLLGIDRPYVLFLGTLEPRKGVADLIQAFGFVAEKKPELQLVLAGQRGWHFETIATALQESAVRDKIRLIDYVDDAYVPTLLRQSTLVCYPSVLEGFGLPVLEALACGATVVTRGDSAHVSLFGDAVLVAEELSPKSLAEAVVFATEDEAKRSAMRARGIEVAAGYSWTKSAADHARLYKKLAG